MWDLESGALFSALNGSLQIWFQFAGRAPGHCQLIRKPAQSITDIELRSILTGQLNCYLLKLSSTVKSVSSNVTFECVL